MRPLTDHERLIVGKAVLTAGCIYEIIALWHPRVPTWSELRDRAERHPVLWLYSLTWDAVWDRHFKRRVFGD